MFTDVRELRVEALCYGVGERFVLCRQALHASKSFQAPEMKTCGAARTGTSTCNSKSGRPARESALMTGGEATQEGSLLFSIEQATVARQSNRHDRGGGRANKHHGHCLYLPRELSFLEVSMQQLPVSHLCESRSCVINPRWKVAFVNAFLKHSSWENTS